MANGLFGSGDGTEANPFLVEDAVDLNAVRNNLTAHYKQVANINLTGIEWVAIGETGANYLNEFTGVFDGDGHEISNLHIKHLPHVTTRNRFLALFAMAGNATFKNIKLSKCIIENGGDYCGGIVGETYDSVIENCHVEALMSLQDYSTSAGGIAGSTNGDTITNCSAIINITGSGNSRTCGGIVGSSYNLTLENCCAIGKFTGVTYSGGLMGDAYYGLTMKNSYAEIDISSTSQYIGALISGIYGGSQIINCYASGQLPNTLELVGLFREMASDTIVNNSYYDATKNTQTTNGYGTPKTTTEMMRQATFENWDFETIWRIDETNDYPRFLWEPIKCVAFPLSTLKVNVIN